MVESKYDSCSQRNERLIICERISADIKMVVNIGFVSSFEGKNKRRENNVLFCPTWLRDGHQHWL